MHDFEFSEKYDCVWIQGVLQYFLDSETIDFLDRARLSGLKKGNGKRTGLVYVTETVQDDYEQAELDYEAYSVFRTVEHFKEIFKAAGFRVAYENE